ncbi:MAG: hypothetical protein ABI556_17250, partial [Gemmatimonadales bacterium]
MLDSFVFLTPLFLLPVVALVVFVGCSSFTGTSETAIYTIDPAKVDLGPGESKQLTAKADGIITTAVKWSPNAPDGLYKAADPRVAGLTNDTVTATSTSDATSVGTATINFKNATVTVSPPLVNLRAGEKQQFSATVQGSPDQNVTWSGATNGLYT